MGGDVSSRNHGLWHIRGARRCPLWLRYGVERELNYSTGLERDQIMSSIQGRDKDLGLKGLREIIFDLHFEKSIWLRRRGLNKAGFKAEKPGKRVAQ